MAGKGGRRSTSFDSERARAAARRPRKPRRTAAQMLEARKALAKVEKVPRLPDLPKEELPDALELAHAYGAPTMSVAIDAAMDPKVDISHRLSAVRLVQQYAEQYRAIEETPELVELRKMIEELKARVESSEKQEKPSGVVGLPGRVKAA